jgi:hypothetical protein
MMLAPTRAMVGVAGESQRMVQIGVKKPEVIQGLPALACSGVDERLMRGICKPEILQMRRK